MKAALTVAVLELALAATACNQVFGLDPIGDGDAGRDAGPQCGDGVVDTSGGANEQCDDGDTASDDGCSSTCQFEYAVIGCSDGRRDGFLDLANWPAVAACAGGWTEPGLARPPIGANCARAGNDTGISAGCAAADLCATGWKVCQNDVLAPATCPETPGFWAVNGGCTGITFVVGCGLDVGGSVTGCEFQRTLGPGCTTNSAAAWTCTAGNERATVRHDDLGGGVLCCRQP